MYCSTDGPECGSNAILLRNLLEKIYNDYGVTLVLSGQLRSYERLSAINNGKIDEEAILSEYINVKYPTYVNCGLGGSQQNVLPCKYHWY